MYMKLVLFNIIVEQTSSVIFLVVENGFLVYQGRKKKKLILIILISNCIKALGSFIQTSFLLDLCIESFQSCIAKKIIKGKVTSAEALTSLLRFHYLRGVLVISVVLCKMQRNKHFNLFTDLPMN